MTKLTLFTSDLIIDSSREDVEKDFAKRAEELAESLETDFNWWKYPKLKEKGFNPLKYHYFRNKDFVEKVCKEYSERKGLNFIDATSCVKGLFLGALYETVGYDFLFDGSFGSAKFLLSFGGDIFGTDTDYTIQIENSPIRLKPTNYPFYCFTSGNFGRRGRHIEITNPAEYDEWKSLTVCGNLDQTQFGFEKSLAYLDCYTTYKYALQDPSDVEASKGLVESLTHIWVHLNGEVEIDPVIIGKGGVQWFI